MGNDCSIDTQITMNELDKDVTQNDSIFTDSKSDLKTYLTIKCYKDYSSKLNIISNLIKDRLASYSKHIDLSFKKERLINRIPFSSQRFKSLVSLERLNDVMQTIYLRINSIYTNSYCYPRSELSKVSYELISNYISYEDFNETTEDVENKQIANKVIKRLNFFTEEFPSKLKIISRVLRSKKIYCYGYDCHYRLTFYIRPYYTDSIAKKVKKPLNIDYVVFMFFIVEFFLPVLKEKYNFSQEFNIYIDFDNNAIDFDLVKIILYYFNTMYPLALNRICIDKYIDDKSFEGFAEDYFNSVMLCDNNFKAQIIRYFFPSCLPSKYGGVGNFDYKSIDNIESIEDFIEVFLKSVLLKEEK